MHTIIDIQTVTVTAGSQIAIEPVEFPEVNRGRYLLPWTVQAANANGMEIVNIQTEQGDAFLFDRQGQAVRYGRIPYGTMLRLLFAAEDGQTPGARFVVLNNNIRPYPIIRTAPAQNAIVAAPVAAKTSAKEGK